MIDDEPDDLACEPKHPGFAAHFSDPLYDDPGEEFAPFGNDEGADLLAQWTARADELDQDTPLSTLLDEWTDGAPLALGDLDLNDVDTLDTVIGAGFTLLRLTGQIDAAGKEFLIRAIELRDTFYGRTFPQSRRMLADLAAFPGHRGIEEEPR